MPKIELANISKRFPGGKDALEGIGLTIEDGEILAVLGPSGSGKSTLLRLIAGLEQPSSGRLAIGGRDMAAVPARRRGVAMVFQNQAPFPHLDVFDNLAFGARARGVPAAEIGERVERASRSLGISGELQRMPGTMSGGERQRVALGRAIVTRPSILLLDEPFSNLDAPLRQALRSRLLSAHREMGTTTVFVTHDQQEAVAVGDRVAVLDRGRLEQVGRAEELLDRPATLFVATFLGDPPMGTMPAEVAVEGGLMRLRIGERTSDDAIEIPRETPWGETVRRLGPGRYRLGLRAEAVSPLSTGTSEPLPALSLRLSAIENRGDGRIGRAGEGADGFWVRLPMEQETRVEDAILLGLDLDRASWFDAETRARVS